MGSDTDAGQPHRPDGESVQQAVRQQTAADALRWRQVFRSEERQLGVMRRWLTSLLPDWPARDDALSVANEPALPAMSAEDSCGRRSPGLIPIMLPVRSPRTLTGRRSAKVRRRLPGDSLGFRHGSGEPRCAGGRCPVQVTWSVHRRRRNWPRCCIGWRKPPTQGCPAPLGNPTGPGTRSPAGHRSVSQVPGPSVPGLAPGHGREALVRTTLTAEVDRTSRTGCQTRSRVARGPFRAARAPPLSLLR